MFRGADDNRLTSWRWAFAEIDLAVFVPVFILGLIAAYVLSRIIVIERRPVIVLFFSSFIICSIFWQVPEVIVDASRYFSQAKHLEVYGVEYFIGEWGGGINAWTDLPLLPFLYGLIFKYIGESRMYIQIFISILFSMTVVITYMTGKTLWDEQTGFFAGALLLGVPYIFSQVPLMLVDMPTMFFLLLSVFTFIKAVEKGSVWIFFSSAAIFAAFFSKYSTWMMLTVIPVIFLVYLIQGRKSNCELRITNYEQRVVLFRTVLVAVFAGLLIGIVVFYKYDVFMDQIAFLNEYQRPGLRRWGESFVSTFLFQVHPFITMAALWSFYEAFKKRDPKFIIVSWLIVLIVLLQIRRARYVMLLFPMVALMASYGLQLIRNVEVRRYIVYCAVVSSLIIAVFAYLPFLSSMSLVNLKEAGRYLDSIDAERVEIFSVPSQKTIVNPAISIPILDYFTAKEIVYYHDEHYSLPFEKIEKSPLRFTWEYKNPAYYTLDPEAAGDGPVIAVISNGPMSVLPKALKERLSGYKNAEVFKTSTGIFRYSPVVSIYSE